MVLKLMVFGLCILQFHPGYSQFKHEANASVKLKPFALYNGAKQFRSAGHECGIYSTPEDRQAGKMSLGIDCDSESHRIKSGFVKDKSVIKVVYRSKTYRFKPTDLHGYRDCWGNEYHFYDGKRFELVNRGEGIFIYRQYEWQRKQLVPKYFFSKDFAHAVKPLTLDNIKVEFAGEPLFLTKLRSLARNDFELVKNLHAISLVRKSTQQDVTMPGGS